MRKIYSLVLMATMLLIGTNVWADGVIEIVRGDATLPTTYDNLKEAFAAAQDGDILQLTDDMNESQSDGAAWFGEATSGTLSNYASTDRSITLDLKGHLYNFTGSADYKIVLTRGVLRIKSTGGEGEITSNKSGITVYGTYLKIDAKENTPFAHLIIEENVKITCEKKGIVLNSPLRPEATSEWGWAKADYPVNYCCEIFQDSQFGISNGARIDIHGKVYAKKYACQVGGNIRTPREYLNEDGSYNTSKGAFPYYQENLATGELYLPGKTKTGKVNSNTLGSKWKSSGGTWWSDSEISSSNDLVLTLDDDNYSSYIHVYNTAVLKTDNQDNNEAVGLYSSGFARCYIEGTCEGSTGAWIKGGEVEFHDATVISNWESDYAAATNDGKPSGVAGGGSAIVIESKSGWTGNIEVTISGDTHVSTDHGYAIDEQVTVGGTNVNYLTITGGTFEGGQVPVEITPNAQDPTKNDTVWGQGTMHVSQPTLDAHHNPDTITTITILGAEVKGETNQIGEGEGQVTLAEFIGGQSGTHITYVEDELGNTTMVVSQGEAPATNPDEIFTTWDYIAENQGANKSFAWTKVPEVDEIPENETVVLDELQINSGSALEGTQQLTIKEGAVLEVNRLIMNAYARIIVEAGGKLIVNGTQGISAPSTQNIVLESTADKQAYFLFNPAVSSNKHPNAQVVVNTVCKQLTASPYTYVYQRIASPLKDTLTVAPANDFSGTLFSGASVFKSYLFHWDMAQEKWVTGLWTEMAPFTGYQLANNSQDGGVNYTFSGQLVGNKDGDYRFAGEGFDFFGNSYTAPIYIKNIFDHFNNEGVQAAVWVYDYAGGNYIAITPDDFDGTGFPEWLNGSPLKEIAPFAGFIMKLDDATKGNVAKMNYSAAIWGNPDVNPSAAAPARKSQATADRVTLRVEAANGNADMIKFVQSDRFTEAFDNGADASKYFSENGINLYAVTNDGELARVATNDLENTVLAFQAGDATEYTISVPAQSGETFMLRDLVTNQTMLMTAGSTYAFNQEAYSTNNARFEIVAAAKMPTAIDNTEVKANVKGIYTITGQYVGENFEVLPAGVYVVNGVKIVK